MTGKVCQNPVRGFRPDDGNQLLARRRADARQAAEGDQQGLAAPRSDAGDLVQVRPQVALRARLAVEGDGEPVRLVADPRDEQQRGARRRQRDRIDAIAREQQLLFLGDADRDEIRQPELLERGIRGRELAFAAVDEDEIGKRPAELEHRAVAPPNDFLHGGEVVEDALRLSDVRGPMTDVRYAWLAAADSKLAILGTLHAAIFANDHGGDSLRALNGGNVEALDAPRDGRQTQHVTQRLQRVVVRGDVFVEASLVGHLRVPRCQVQQPPLFSTLRHDYPHAV